MQRLLLGLLLAIVNGSAAAEWVWVGQGSTYTAYVDPATIRKSGHTVKMWDLLDGKSDGLTKANKRFISQKSQQEYDCKEEQVRLLYFSLHSQPMGGGEVVYSSPEPEKWSPIPPNSVSEAMWKFACGKR